MFIDNKPFVYLWRPLHRRLFQGIIWPFLARVKVFFFLEADREFAKRREDHAATMATLIAIETQNNTLITQINALNARVAAMETEQVNQWDQFEKLLLCFYQQPKSTDWKQPGNYPLERESGLSRATVSRSSV